MAAWLTVIVTLLGVFVALAGVWWQVKRQWLLNSANLVTQLNDRWNSTEWCRLRKHCADLLLKHLTGEKVLGLAEPFPVLEFFENLAYLVRRGAIDKMMVWNYFGWYSVGYHMGLTRPTNQLQKTRDSEGNPKLWVEFEWFVHASLKIDKSQGVQVDDAELRDTRFTTCWSVN